MKVAKRVTASNVSHNVLNRSEGSFYMRSVVHRQENTSNKLKGEEKASERAKASVVVKITGSWVIEQVICCGIRKRFWGSIKHAVGVIVSRH